MTREEAIWYVNHTFEIIKEELCNNGRFDEAKKFEIAQNMAIEAIKKQTVYEQVKWERDMALQTLEEHGIGLGQKSDWIPVSEGLPEDGRDVLVYLSSRRMTIACYNNHKLPFRNKAIGWGYKPLQGKIDFVNECVIAWQPLPAPYKESDKE